MLFLPNAMLNSLAIGAALLGVSMPVTTCAELPAHHPGLVAELEAQFRGCDSAGWCRFWIESLDPWAQSVHRVRPDGVSRKPANDVVSIAVRNRLNSLLSNMIHQHKRIVLHDLRELDDGTFAATVTVNDLNVASDPILLDLRKKLSGTNRSFPSGVCPVSP